jgi:hypothetical protein
MLSVNGRSSLRGRILFERFKQVSEECLLGHFVATEQDEPLFQDHRFGTDLVTPHLMSRLHPDHVCSARRGRPVGVDRP